MGLVSLKEEIRKRPLSLPHEPQEETDFLHRKEGPHQEPEHAGP